MAKIIKQKKLKRIPATIFKYEKKSKFYYVRFWVCKGYRYNGCEVQSLKVAEERLAEKEEEKSPSLDEQSDSTSNVEFTYQWTAKVNEKTNTPTRTKTRTKSKSKTQNPEK